MRRHILVAAEEAVIRAALARILQTAGHTVELTGHGRRARDLSRKGKLGAAILVPASCNKAGLQLGRELSAVVSKVIILVRSADDQSVVSRWIPQADVLLYPPDELRLLALVLKDTRKTPESFEQHRSTVRFCGRTLDLAGRVVLNSQGQEIPLTRNEFAALSAFVQNPGRALSREYLRQFVSGRDLESDDRSIDVLIGRLRRKIEERTSPRLIVTVPGAGYKLVVRANELEWDASSPGPKPVPIDRTHVPERRQVTIMACRAVGLASLASAIDPEDLQIVVGTVQQRFAELIARFRGTVVQSLGDSMLAYFGYPRAREEDAENAVRAGLELIRHFPQLDTLSTQRLAARIGIATGLAVVGDLSLAGGREPSAVGDAMILAGHLQAAAPSGGMLIADSTCDLVGSNFECRPFRPVAMDDHGHASAWQVLDEGATIGRFEALRLSHLLGFVGRSEELDRLFRHWSKASLGAGQLVVLTGEAGIGKSRLVIELEQRVAIGPHARLKYSGLPHQVDAPMAALLDEIRRSAGFTIEDSPSQKFQKLQTLLKADDPDDTAILLSELSGLPVSVKNTAESLSPQRRKSRAFALLLKRIERLAARHPLLIVWEDAQWIDPTSLEFLALLAEQAAAWPLLIVVVGRQEFAPPWPDHAHMTALTVSRMSPSDSEALIDLVADGQRLPAPVKSQILARADGVPLFVEELTKSIFAVDPLGRPAGNRIEAGKAIIPRTLHAFLLERIDQLGAEKTIAQEGAAIGREFSYEFLRMITDISEPEIAGALDRLVASGLVFRRGQYPQARFVFKHALVRDAAYGMLLRARRQIVHTRIARALEDHFPEIVQQQPELLAYHCKEAGMAAKAVGYLLVAAKRAVLRSGTTETLALVSEAQSLVSALPETPQRSQLELELEIALGRVFTAQRSFTAPETRQAYLRARARCESLDNQEWLPLIIFGQWVGAWSASDSRLALKHAQELQTCGERNRAASVIAVSHMAFGMTLTLLGNVIEARQQFEKALRINQFAMPSQQPFLFPDAHGRISSLTYLHDCLLLLGYPEQAEPLANQAETLLNGAEVQSAGQRYFQALAQNHILRMYLFRRDVPKVAKLGSALLRFAQEQDYAYFIGTGKICTGWALVQSGDAREGLELCRQGTEELRAVGAKCWLPRDLALVAECHAKAGDFERGYRTIIEAQADAAGVTENVWDAELCRLKGRLLMLAGDDPNRIETCFREALTTARRQHLRLFELRAATSYAEWLIQNGKQMRVKSLLVPIYNSFSEFGDCVDVREAKALLERVANSSAA